MSHDCCAKMPHVDGPVRFEYVQLVTGSRVRWGVHHWLAWLWLLLAAGCAKEINDAKLPAPGDGGLLDGGAMDAAPDPFGNPDRGNLSNIPDAARIHDAMPTVDAFFVNDPPPQYCGPDAGGGSAQNPGGTVECPDDKNREGCPCPEVGMEAACWPGKRANRNHGICKDGTTVCNADPEFGPRWGPCEGYVLPEEGVSAGPEACGCFSSGQWSLTNLSPCIFTGTNRTYLYSSWLDSNGDIQCGGPYPDDMRPPAPDMAWSQSTLNVDCAGQFRLCFTIKAGDVDDPQPDDCEIMTSCVDVWYGEEGVDQELPDLPAWSSGTSSCARMFYRNGGYGEMSVIGESIECDVVDDGSGNPFVFHRTNYCAPTCLDTPNTPECMGCRTGGSGQF